VNVSAEIAELWSAGTPVLYVVTREEDRAVALCQAAATAFDARSGVWSSNRGLEPLAQGAKDPAALLDVLLEAPAPYLCVALDFHEALASPAVARKLRDLLPRYSTEGRCLVVVAPRLQLPEGLGGDTAVLRLPLPDEGELAALLDAVHASAAGPGAPPLAAGARHRALVAARGLTDPQARRVLTRAVRRDPALGPEGVAVIAAEKSRLLATDLGLELVYSAQGPDELGGLKTFKSWMEERALAFDPDASRYGLPPPRGVLLVGVQGCGKSLAAKAAAARLGVPILRLDLPRVLGSRAGAEEGLARALEAAEALAPVTLWVDEIEKGFAGSTPGDGGDPRAARLLGAFSTWLQERSGPVFVVATANDVSRLPPELMRRGRFDELFFVDLPDLESRTEILELHLRRRGREPSALDVVGIAELCADYSGAELEQVVVGALHHAYAQGREVETSDLRRIAQDLVPLYRTYEEQIKALREWARGRARTAGRAGAVIDLFRQVQG
jgi:hypothetical protein